MKKDYILQKKIEDISTDDELKTIVDFIQDLPHQTQSRREIIELFFLKIKRLLPCSWTYLIVEFCNIYNIDIELIINNKSLFNRIKKEKIKPYNSSFLLLF